MWKQPFCPIQAKKWPKSGFYPHQGKKEWVLFSKRMELCGINHKIYSPRGRPSHSGVWRSPSFQTSFPCFSIKGWLPGNQEDRELQENNPRRERGSHENGKHDWDVGETWSYIYAIDGMETARIHTHLMLGTHSFKKHRGVGNGHAQREQPKHPILRFALSGTPTDNTAKNNSCIQLRWYKCTCLAGGGWQVLEEEKRRED